MSQNNASGFTVNVGNELMDNLVVHKNVKQELILTTEDKLRLLLIERKESLTSQRDWWTPAGLLLSFLTTLSTSDFKDSYSITKDTWKAMFIILSMLTCIWLINTLYKLYKNRGKADLNKLIDNLKLKPQGSASIEEVNKILKTEYKHRFARSYLYQEGDPGLKNPGV